jgi:hypothetical protein
MRTQHFGATHTYREVRRFYSRVESTAIDLTEDPSNVSTTTDLVPRGAWHASGPSQMTDEAQAMGQLHPRHGSMMRKRRRLSRPALVLQSLQTPAQDMYFNPSVGKVDLSYRSPHRFKAGGIPSRNARLSFRETDTAHIPQPVSLYSILARYLDHQTESHRVDPEYALTAHERSLLHHKGFTLTSVESWATCLSEHSSRAAVAIFESDKEMPPLFVLLLFLRRQHMSAFAFGVILRHVDRRMKSEPLTWTALKLLSVRLLRHARKLWPESIPWVASLFAAEASALFEGDRLCTASPRMLSDVTKFSNTFLLLLSLPASITPVLGALNQEKAQFQVLQFMASRTPAITVTNLGFRSISRTQLAHPKTTAEREWAELKGPSWPPWKENRTAMDEDKGYDFGASRASKIIHRMYEAGYRGHTWEEMAEVYAGWDVDFSPTIQTRTSLPHVSSQFRNKKYLAALLWAGRVTTTRTRREAWACFLAYELSGAHASCQVYLAMFEKLYHFTMKRSSKHKSQSDLDEVLKADDQLDESDKDLLPGDMKEVLPDPTSPLHYVYLSEPIPTIKELYHRMYMHNIHPSNRLLAFLLEAAPTLQTCINMCEAAKEDFNGGIGHLIHGQHGDNSSVGAVPGYLLAAFIKSLCRFGRFVRTPRENPRFISPERHAYELKHNRHYLIDYAYALLYHYRPLYRPAWAAFMDKLVQGSSNTTIHSDEESTVRGKNITQYVIIWKLVKSMGQIDLDVDEQIFQSVCKATTLAAQAATRGTVSTEDARHVLTTGSPRLRKLFHSLVGANMDMMYVSTSINQESNIIPPHVPGPAVLHAYVRALGTLRDYEGLYSFSTWLTRHRAEVSARSEAQHSGSSWLFRTLVALRAAVTGQLEDASSHGSRASEEIVQLVRSQIEGVEEWGGWPRQEYVDLYIKGGLKSKQPGVRGK